MQPNESSTSRRPLSLFAVLITAPSCQPRTFYVCKFCTDRTRFQTHFPQWGCFWRANLSIVKPLFLAVKLFQIIKFTTFHSLASLFRQLVKAVNLYISFPQTAESSLACNHSSPNIYQHHSLFVDHHLRAYFHCGTTAFAVS